MCKKTEKKKNKRDEQKEEKTGQQLQLNKPH